MPLRDHFSPPLSTQRPWESFHTTWASAIADGLNRDVLPRDYIALEHVQAGAAVEIDVATFRDEATGGEVNGGTRIAVAPHAVWTPATAPIVAPATFPPEATVEIRSTDGGRALVAAIELISPANKDRRVARRLFVGKCSAYLARGVGLIVVDVVSHRHANLHNELVEFLGWDDANRLSAESGLYAVAYRPLRIADEDVIHSWPVALCLDQPLPTLPLSLAADLCLPLDLDESYEETCRRRRIGEAID